MELKQDQMTENDLLSSKRHRIGVMDQPTVLRLVHEWIRSSYVRQPIEEVLRHFTPWADDEPLVPMLWNGQIQCLAATMWKANECGVIYPCSDRDMINHFVFNVKGNVVTKNATVLKKSRGGLMYQGSIPEHALSKTAKRFWDVISGLN